MKFKKILDNGIKGFLFGIFLVSGSAFFSAIYVIIKKIFYLECINTKYTIKLIEEGLSVKFFCISVQVIMLIFFIFLTFFTWVLFNWYNKK